MRRLFITGVDGFVGRASREALRQAPTAQFELVTPRTVMELRDSASIAAAIDSTRPDFVLHLAAQSFVPTSIEKPRATYEVNFLGTLNLLEALKSSGFRGRLLYVSSGEVYGLVREETLPLDESHPLRPRNPYSVSKAAAEMLCYQWSQTDFEIVTARPFNHIGPGQAKWFVVPDFARQVAEIKLGLREPVVRVGSTDVTRDFIDVRDVVRAYFGLLTGGESGEAYNVCSGTECSIQSILERLIAMADIKCRIERDPVRLRANEQKRMRGSYAKLNKRIGWQPVIDIDQSLRAVLSHWEEKLKDA